MSARRARGVHRAERLGRASLLVVLAVASHASASTIEGLATHPTLPVFYTTTEPTHRFSARHASDSSFNFGVTLPETVGDLAIDPDGTRAYVALLDSNDIAVIDLNARAVVGTIDLSGTAGPAGLAAGRPGRLYCISRTSIAVVDTTAGVEIGTWAAPSTVDYTEDAAISEDGSRYYVMTALSPTYTYAFDVSTDVVRRAGQQCCHGCVGGWIGTQIALSPDGNRIAVASNSGSSGVPLFETTSVFPEVGRIAVSDVTGVAFSPDGRYMAIGCARDLFIADATTLLPIRRDPVSAVVAPGLAVTADSQWLGIVTESAGNESLGIRSLAGVVPNRGGVKFRAVDSATNWPIPSPAVNYSSAYIDIGTATSGMPNRAPGGFTVQFDTGDGYEALDIPTAIVAGQWTDIGTVPRTPIAPRGYLPDVCASPPACAGTTALVSVRGDLLLPDMIIGDNTAGLTVVSQQWIDWGRIDAVVTLDPGVRQGVFNGMTVSTYVGGWGLWLSINGAADPVSPPGAVRDLRMTKVGTDVRFTWQGIVRDVQGCTDDTAAHEVWRALRADMADGATWRTVSVALHVEPGMAVPGGGSAEFYIVRARDTAGSLGP